MKGKSGFYAWQDLGSPALEELEHESWNLGKFS